MGQVEAMQTATLFGPAEGTGAPEHDSRPKVGIVYVRMQARQARQLLMSQAEDLCEHRPANIHTGDSIYSAVPECFGRNRMYTICLYTLENCECALLVVISQSGCRRARLVVRTPRCGRGNLGSIPRRDTHLFFCECDTFTVF